MSRQLVRTGNAAKHLGVTRQWILKLVKSGQLRRYECNSPHCYITVNELRRYASDNDMEFFELSKEADSCA
jgi:hypothetical protein